MLRRYRAWNLTWGATPAEVSARLPGDDLIDRVRFEATRAVDVAAPPEAVWPWIVQAGFGRAGWYSYDLIDNLGRPSARRVLAEYQQVEVGDLTAPLMGAPSERTAFRVAEVRPPAVLVWARPDLTWSWQLTEQSVGTRLVTRFRLRDDGRRGRALLGLLLELGDFPMMRKMLLGIAERAEALASASSGPSA